MLRGALLSVAVLLAGIMLLGLSGWFITATGLAGLAGVGIAFDVFRPSAGIRLLALGRAAGRYGERLLTHDATLRALAGLRVTLLRARMRADWETLGRLRPGPALTRLTADIDALDGAALRLALPVAAGLGVLLATAAGLWWLTHWSLALIILAQGAAAAVVLARLGRRSLAPSMRAERRGQALLRGTVAMLRGQVDMAVHGGLQARLSLLLARGRGLERAAARLERMSERADAGLGVVTAVAVTLLLLRGGMLVEAGRLGAAAAAVPVFAALALQEAVALIRPGMSGLGAMADAARRAMAPPEAGAETPPDPAPFPAPAPAVIPGGGAQGAGLVLERIALARPGADLPVLENVSLRVAPGETVALTGPSGGGKSTLLLIAAGVLAPQRGEVRIDGRPVAAWDEPALRGRLAMLPQRSQLLAGTVAENLALAGGHADAAEMEAVLEAVALAPVLAPRGGMAARLGEGGAGLSGGETRRLALARVLLRRPSILLLDEPTEGLDPATAARVLDGIRRIRPAAAILCAAHRPEEKLWADRVFPLSSCDKAGSLDSGQSANSRNGA
nr:ATP-binding cassette domain-containing protein [Mangrovicoccus algicola]